MAYRARTAGLAQRRLNRNWSSLVGVSLGCFDFLEDLLATLLRCQRRLLAKPLL
jgi:hypothetical protein